MEIKEIDLLPREKIYTLFRGDELCLLLQLHHHLGTGRNI